MSRFSKRHDVCITRATHSKIGMCWGRIAQESLLDGVGIWIDSRLISCQPLLSPIVPSVSYLGLEDCGTIPVGTGVVSPADGLAQGIGEIGRNSLSLHKILDQPASA